MSETYSYSKLSCFEGCGFKYKLKYEDKISVFSSSIALEFGTLVHQIEENIANDIKNGRKIDYQTYKNQFMLSMIDLEYKYKNDFLVLDKSNRTYKDKWYEYLKKGIYRLENFCNSHPSYEIFGVEDNFKIDFNETSTLNGKIDRIFKDTATGKYLLQDIKTWATPASHDELITPLQFVFYSLALKQKYGIEFYNISCQYDLPFCDLAQDAGTNGFVERGIKKINKIFEGINNKSFEPKPSALCYFCEYCQNNPSAEGEPKYMCPYYCHWTREKKIFTKENEWQGLDKHEEVFKQFLEKYNITLTIK